MAGGRKPREGVSLTAIADMLGVSTRQVQVYRSEGMPHRDTDGTITYVPRECVRWRLERERETARDESTPTEAAERARKIRAEADLKELQLAERRRQLVEVADYDARLDAIVGGLVAVVSGRLSRFEREIVQCTTPGEARRITGRMQEAIMEGARTMADEIEAEADALEAASPTDADEESAA